MKSLLCLRGRGKRNIFNVSAQHKLRRLLLIIAEHVAYSYIS